MSGIYKGVDVSVGARMDGLKDGWVYGRMMDGWMKLKLGEWMVNGGK